MPRSSCGRVDPHAAARISGVPFRAAEVSATLSGLHAQAAIGPRSTGGVPSPHECLLRRGRRASAAQRGEPQHPRAGGLLGGDVDGAGRPSSPRPRTFPCTLAAPATRSRRRVRRSSSGRATSRSSTTRTRAAHTAGRHNEVRPVFGRDRRRPDWFLVNRAHHADIGGSTPGSMGIAADLYAEGLVLPAVLSALAASCSRTCCACSKNVRGSGRAAAGPARAGSEPAPARATAAGLRGRSRQRDGSATH